MASKSRSKNQIVKDLRSQRKKLYSKRDRLIEKRSKLDITNSSEKQRLKLEKSIDYVTKRIDSRTTKLFRYSNKYDALKSQKKSRENSNRALLRQLKNPELSPKERNEITKKLRKNSLDIEKLKVVMKLPVRIKRGKPAFFEKRAEGIVTDSEPFWNAESAFKLFLSTNEYKTIDIEGEIFSTDSYLSIKFAFDNFIADIEANRFKINEYWVAFEGDTNTGHLTIWRT